MSKPNMYIAMALVALCFSAFAYAEESPPIECNADADHASGDQPHTQGTDDPNEDDQCHGKPGDVGVCLVGSGNASAGMTCIVEVSGSLILRGCVANAQCTPGQSLSCGGLNAEAVAGIDRGTGKAYVHCKKGLATSFLACP